jgi:hypothetical protein
MHERIKNLPSTIFLISMLEKTKKEGKLEKPPIAIVASHWKTCLEATTSY